MPRYIYILSFAIVATTVNLLIFTQAALPQPFATFNLVSAILCFVMGVWIGVERWREHNKGTND